ncbi:hypothetical protein Fmac_032632 [Flemingia macrophylla]|uniref:Uncharacterized protein n=1 Tax=Flemingia macrophylla TaxID=520843 RepID=A0ABD1L5H0_9FABA
MSISFTFMNFTFYMPYHKEAMIPRKPSYHNDHLYDEDRKDKEYAKWYKREKTFGYDHNFPPSYDEIFSSLSTKSKKKKSSSKQFSKRTSSSHDSINYSTCRNKDFVCFT